MNDASRGKDAPYLRPFNDGHWGLAVLLVAIFATLGIACYQLYERWSRPEPEGDRTSASTKPGGTRVERPNASPPPKSFSDPTSNLPPLKDSDAMIGRSLSDVLGPRAFRELAIPEQLVRRIVATVDNLPRPTAPRRVMPFNQVPGALLVVSEGSNVTLDEANAQRYRSYVNVFMAIDIPALVRRYVAVYPLFERAFAELGYPGQPFHSRLIEAIDDMLAAPELDAPVRLVRPKVLYQFADPALEALSAGQKVMMRIGPDNERKVKEKLRQLRAALIRTI